MNLSQLPRDPLMLILFESSYEDIIRLCQTNSSFRSLCSNDVFWRLKYLRDFGPPSPFRGSGPVPSLRHQYQKMYDFKNPCRPGRSRSLYPDVQQCLQIAIRQGNWANYQYFKSLRNVSVYSTDARIAIAVGNVRILTDILTSNRSLTTSKIITDLIEDALDKKRLEIATVLLNFVPKDLNHHLSSFLQELAAKIGSIPVYEAMVSQYGATSFTSSVVQSIVHHQSEMIDHILTTTPRTQLDLNQVLHALGKVGDLTRILVLLPEVENGIVSVIKGALEGPQIKLIRSLISLGVSIPESVIYRHIQTNKYYALEFDDLVAIVPVPDWSRISNCLIRENNWYSFEFYRFHFTPEQVLEGGIRRGEQQWIDESISKVSDLNPFLIQAIENRNSTAIDRLLTAGANNFAKALFAIADNGGSVKLARLLIKLDQGRTITPQVLNNVAMILTADRSEEIDLLFLEYLLSLGVNPDPILQQAIREDNEEVIDYFASR